MRATRMGSYKWRIALFSFFLSLIAFVSCDVSFGRPLGNDITLKFLVHGISKASPQAMPGSRLLLPTADTLQVALVPLEDGLTHADDQFVDISSGTVEVPVTFKRVIIGRYRIEVSATRGVGGAVLFHQLADLDLTKAAPALTVNLIAEGAPALPDTTYTMDAAAIGPGLALTWQISDQSPMRSSDGIYITGLYSTSMVYLQGPDGALLHSNEAVTGGTAWIPRSSMPAAGDIYLTIYNSSEYEVLMGATYYAAYSIRYDANGGVGACPSDELYRENNYSSTVARNTGNLAGPLIQDGIRQRFIGWFSSPTGGMQYTIDDDLMIFGTSHILYARYTTDDSVIGKVGPAGGIVFYDRGSVVDGWRYLEAATGGNTGVPPAGFNLFSNVIDASVGTTGSAIGTGMANTMAIIGQSGHANSNALWCRNYTQAFNGVVYIDYFLPSFDELVAFATVLASIGGPHLSWDYCSSTELPSSPATGCLTVWFQGDGVFGYDQTVNMSKDNPKQTKPIRAFY